MRRPNDFYETPEYYVQQLLAAVKIGDKVFEPCAGGGAISRFFPSCRTNDIDHTKKADFHFDAADYNQWPQACPPGLFDWVVTNPPFKDAFPILRAAFAFAYNVATLLRISFFEPTLERELWLVENPPTGLIYLPRYSFTGNGKSDSATVVWGVWQASKCSQFVKIAPRFPA